MGNSLIWSVLFCVYAFVPSPEDWIDWADQNSQAGLPKPPFETEDGEPIFPEEEEAWWLTDISRRAAPEEKAEGDEDGPASDLEEPLEEQKQGEVTDSDASEPGESGAGYDILGDLICLVMLILQFCLWSGEGLRCRDSVGFVRG